jgi:hypothetical protein
MSESKVKLFGIYDIVSNVDTTIKLTRGIFPNGKAFFEFHQLTGNYVTVEEFDKAIDKEHHIKNYFCVYPDDAKNIHTAFFEILTE